jgi:hypothetical protein
MSINGAVKNLLITEDKIQNRIRNQTLAYGACASSPAMPMRAISE